MFVCLVHVLILNRECLSVIRRLLVFTSSVSRWLLVPYSSVTFDVLRLVGMSLSVMECDG